MAAKIIYGKDVTREILADVATDVTKLQNNGFHPGLATIVVGNESSSSIYVRQVETLFKKMKVFFRKVLLDVAVSEDRVKEEIHSLNKDSRFTGILLMHPFPVHINLFNLFNEIDTEKDIEGLHHINMGKFLSSKDINEMTKKKMLLSCAPFGIIEILNYLGIDIKGQEVVIVGRGHGGNPILLLLLASNATVTVCHKETTNLEDVTRRADILISVAGQAGLITSNMVKDGAIVIDVGINRATGGKIVGDVDFDAVKKKVYAITPVPGGVGPVTTTMLLKNVITLAKRVL